MNAPWRMVHALDPMLPPRRFVPRSRFERAGIAPEHETWFNIALGMLVLVFGLGWSLAIYRSVAADGGAPLLTRAIAPARLSAEPPPEAAFVLDAALRALAAQRLRGASGAVRVVVGSRGQGLSADSLPTGVAIRYSGGGDSASSAAAPSTPGVWNVLIAMRNVVRQVPNLSLLTLVPLSEKRGGRIGGYVIGNWPYERGGKPRSAAYAPPAGLIKVTPENMNTQVSDHFRLRDFLTKGQQDVWPKYVAMSPRLLDKLELTIQQLNKSGTPVTHVGVISGFRTPTYNESGGNPAGRGALSRHMYGDAMDVYIDNNRDGRMDDLNHDGRVDTADGRVMVKAAEAVETAHPDLIGGIGLYAPTGAHSGFVHIDTRGYRARW